jgi:hypothetical protein
MPSQHIIQLERIRQQARDIENFADDIEILSQAIFSKIDMEPGTVGTLDAINCFATCIRRNAVLIKEQQAIIVDLSLAAADKKGGAQ